MSDYIQSVINAHIREERAKREAHDKHMEEIEQRILAHPGKGPALPYNGVSFYGTPSQLLSFLEHMWMAALPDVF